MGKEIKTLIKNQKSSNNWCQDDGGIEMLLVEGVGNEPCVGKVVPLALSAIVPSLVCQILFSYRDIVTFGLDSTWNLL